MFEEQARDVELMLQKRLRTQCDLPIYFSTASPSLPITPEPYDKVDPPVRVKEMPSSTAGEMRRRNRQDGGLPKAASLNSKGLGEPPSRLGVGIGEISSPK